MAKALKTIQMNNEFSTGTISTNQTYSLTANLLFNNSYYQIYTSIMNTLLIDFDVELFNKLESKLLNSGIKLKHASTTESALMFLKHENINCILYNPFKISQDNTYDFIKKTAEINYTGGIVVLSYNRNVDEQIRALNEGADAFLPIPFVIDELIARIKSLCKIRNTSAKDIIIFNELKLDKPERRFYINDKLVFLTKTEFELLAYLIENKGKVISRHELIIHCWNEKKNIDKYSVALYSHVKNIKKKIYETIEKEYLETVYGVGYWIRDSKI